MPELDVADLRRRAVARLCREGVKEHDARVVVEHMLTADLWGRSSHGLSVRFEHVLRQARDGAPGRRPEVVHDGGHVVAVDGHNGFGYLAAHFATRLLIDRALEHGLAAVALRNSLHTGMLGYYADMVARADVVGMAFGNCCPLMAPYGGKRRLLGTNPLAFGFPAEPAPVIVDMATARLAYGEVMERQRAGEPLPAGCALDGEGNPTRDPAAARAGALLPFGRHKGGALAVAVQLLAGAFTGATPVPPPGREYGLLLVGFSKGLFAGTEGYDEGVRLFAEQYLSVPARRGYEVRLPGARRYATMWQRSGGKVRVTDGLLELLNQK